MQRTFTWVWFALMVPATHSLAEPGGCGAACINIQAHGAKGDGISRKVNEADRLRFGWPTSRLGMELDTAAIQSALAAARPGDEILFPRGIYLISHGDWGLKSGVKMLGRLARMVASSENSVDVRFKASSVNKLEDFVLDGFHFENIAFFFDAYSSPGAIKNIRITNSVFFDGGQSARKVNPSWVPSQIAFYCGEGLEVTNTHFRRALAYNGRSIVVHGSNRITINNNNWNGHFATALTVGGATLSGARKISSNIIFIGNRLTRTAGNYYEDHGIYIQEFSRVNVSSNEIDGWSFTSAGGSLKLRNGDTATVRNNRMIGSGIYLYAYRSDFTGAGVPLFLRSVVIDHNYIDLTKSVASDPITEELRPGISYYRTIDQPDDATEQNIVMEFNNIRKGSIYIHSTSRGGAFRIAQNRASSFLLNATGINSQSNEVVP
jgi:hypothetical protein